MSRAARLCRSGSWTCTLHALGLGLNPKLGAVNAAGATRKHLTPQMYDAMNMNITETHLCPLIIFPTANVFHKKIKKLSQLQRSRRSHVIEREYFCSVTVW